jgi:hypothetical protein
MTPDADQDEAAADPVYAFKPSLMGAICRFTLRPDVMDWEIGRRSGSLRYDRVKAIRLSYRPLTMQAHRFVTEIWSTDMPKIQIFSVSWRSMLEQERLDQAYSAFVTELHRRLAAAGTQARFSRGLPVAIYWIGVGVFGCVMLATCALLIRAASLDQWSAAAVIAVFFAALAYQVGAFFYYNWPERYRPDAVPPVALPG